MSNFILRYRVPISIFFIILTLAVSFFIPRLTFDSDIKKLLPESINSIKNLRYIENLFSNTDSLAIALKVKKHPNIFNAESLKILYILQTDIEKIKGVYQIYSLYSIQNPHLEDQLTFIPFLDGSNLPSPEEYEKVMGEIQKNPQIYGKFISKNFSSLLFVINLEKDFDTETVVKAIEKLQKKYSDSIEFHTSGQAFLHTKINEYLKKDIVSLITFGLISIIIILFIGFRSLRGVLMPLLTVFMSLLFTLGLMALFNIRITVMSLIIPVMLIAIANNYAIHFVTRYYEDTRINGITDKKILISQSFKSLNRPVFLSFLTTVLAFLSFIGSPLPRLTEVGIFVAIGITYSFVLTMIFIPAVLSMFSTPRKTGNVNLVTSSVSHKLTGIIFRYKTILLIIVFVIIVFSIVMFSLIKVESDYITFFKKSSPIRVDSDFINHNLIGSQFLNIILQGDLNDVSFLKKADIFVSYCEQYPQIKNVNSITNTIKTLHRVLNNENPQLYNIPENQGTASELLFLIESALTPGQFNSLVTPDYGSMLIQINIDSTNYFNIKKFQLDLQSKSNELFGNMHLVMSGIPVINDEVSRQIIRSMIQSLFFAILFIFLSVFIGFKNIRMGFICSIIMSVVIVIIFGSMGSMGILLNIATAIVSSIVLGVGIDYSIHFSERLRIEKTHKSLFDAVENTIHTTGKGIIINALAISFAVIPTFFSNFLPIKNFGILTFNSIIISMLGSIFLIPLIEFFQKKHSM